MPQFDLGPRLLSVAMAIALVFVVYGERRVDYSLSVPVEARLPEGLEPTTPLPSSLRLTVSGPWARLRSLEGGEVGPISIDLSGTGEGAASWFVRPELLHLPPGVRVESLQPSQGIVQLRPGRP